MEDMENRSAQVRLVGLKTCSTCKDQLHFTAFYSNAARSDGRNQNCKKCFREKQKVYCARRKQRDPVGYHDWRIRNGKTRGVKLEPGLYSRLYAAQAGLCAVCGNPEPPHRRSAMLSVDHDHITGKVRGLLCSNCNFALGHVKDSIEILAALIKYLETCRTTSDSPVSIL